MRCYGMSVLPRRSLCDANDHRQRRYGIYYKDWSSGQPIVFSHGRPLSADDWDAQMLFLFYPGCRVIAHDRRGQDRSTQTGDGHDMNHCADNLAVVTSQLDRNGTLKTYKGFPHGMPTTQAATINADLLAFIT